MADIIAEISSPILEVQMGNGVEGTPVIDDLTSTKTDSALSANQGRILNTAVTANTAAVSQLKADLSSEITRATAVEATKADQTSLNATNAKLQNVIDMTKGVVWKEVTDASLAQTKDVATDSSTSATYSSVASYADMTMLGGMSRKGHNYVPTGLNSTTVSGITIVKNSNGTYTLNGTASDKAMIYIVGSGISETMTVTGDGVKKQCLFNLGGSYSGTITYLVMTASFGGYAELNIGESRVLTNGTTYAQFRVDVAAGTTCNNLVIGAMVADDISEFEPYSDHLLDAAVDEVVTQGKNLCDNSKNAVGYYTTTGYIENNNFRTSEPIKVSNGEKYIGQMVYGGTSAAPVVYTTFANSADTTAVRQVVGGYITVNSGENYIRIRNNSDYSSYVVSGDYAYQFEKGSTTTSYSAYTSTTTTITDALIAKCPDYGIGVNSSCYNYIDFENKVYHRRVGQFTFTGSNVSWLNNNNGNIACKNWGTYNNVNTETANENTITTYLTKKNTYYDSYAGFWIDANVIFNVGKTTYADTVAYLDEHPITVYYPLLVEETIDLSDVLDDDLEFLKVEGGGTVSFHYPEYDNGYVIDMPSSIVYDVNIT